MEVYSYDSTTKEYIGSCIADPDPLVEGRFLLPKNSTAIQPPVKLTHSKQVFDETNESWGMVVDYRNDTVCMIDPDNFFVRQIKMQLGEELQSNMIIASIPVGIYMPKWDNSRWVQGKITPMNEEVDEEKTAMSEAIIDLNARLEKLEKESEQ